MSKKINLIIDCDPGVDDSVAIISALFEKKFNILLFTTVAGNVEINLCTRNLLNVLEYFNKKIPVAKGSDHPLKRELSDASYIHGQDGMGNYTPKTPKTKPIRQNAIEAMYKTIKEHANDITLLVLGPQTNIAKLILKHPDVTGMISKIVYMGANDYSNGPMQTHVSFNIRTDPEAFDIVLNSNIPLVMIPSEIGRQSHLKEEQVDLFKYYKVTGNILYQMLTGYWEPNQFPRYVAMNDTCAVYYVLHPNLFKTKKLDIELDKEIIPGKTIFNYNKKGKITCVTKINIKKFHKLFFEYLDKIDDDENKKIKKEIKNKQKLINNKYKNYKFDYKINKK